MNENWDERTEAIPGTTGDKSFELDVAFMPDAPEEQTVSADMSGPPTCVVFEPAPIGLARALGELGLVMRVGTTGVDVMSMVAAAPPHVVVCAPSPDAERRRLLAAALRLRFPLVPVIYVSTWASQDDAVHGAIREGARAVIPWPLPPKPEVLRRLAPFLALVPKAASEQGLDDHNTVLAPGAKSADHANTAAATVIIAARASARSLDEQPTAQAVVRRDERPTVPVPRPTWAPRPPATPASSESFDDMATLVMPQQGRAPAAGPPGTTDPQRPLGPRPVSLVPSQSATQPPQATRASAPWVLPSPPLETQARPPAVVPSEVPLPVPATNASVIMKRPAVGLADDADEPEPATQPNLQPIAKAPGEALAQRRGELGALLAAVGPFLWSLEDAARWAQALADAGDEGARSHAKSLLLLARILAQLQARIDETGA